MTQISIRPAAPRDVPRVVELANALNRFHDKPENFTEDGVREDLFGPAPAYDLLLAELGGAVVGYALFHDCYNTDIAARGVWLADIYVTDAARGHGAGQALMAGVARAALDRGAKSVWWGVLSSNVRARDFYARVGAVDEDARILELEGDALSRVAGLE